MVRTTGHVAPPHKQGWAEAKELYYIHNFKCKHSYIFDLLNPVSQGFTNILNALLPLLAKAHFKECHFSFIDMDTCQHKLTQQILKC